MEINHAAYIQSRSEGVIMVALCGGLQLWVMAGMFINSYSTSITCDAGTYVVGQPAFVTCNFRRNVSASQLSFNIARYSSVAKSAELGTKVLACHWSDVFNEHDCTVTNGYTFDNVITDQVTVMIPEVGEAFKGLYRCFFVPSKEEDVHACDLKITESVAVEDKSIDSKTDLPTNEDHTFNPTMVAVIVVSAFVGMIACMSVCIVCRRRQKKKRQEEERGCTYALVDLKEAQITKVLEGLELPKKNLEARKPSGVMAILKRELEQGIDNITQSEQDNTTPSVGDDTTQSDAALQMYRLCCPLLDQSGDNSDLLVVDVGCTILKISFVRLRQRAVFTISKSYMMKTSTGNQMFTIIADSIKQFVYDNNLTERKPLHAAIVFPFPCHQTSLNKARLAKCSGEVCFKDIVNKDIQELLQKALQRIQTPCKVQIVAIVNDAVSTLVSVAHKTPDCKIALTVGTGLRACFVKQWRHVGTSGTKETQPDGMVYNTELGALGDNGCLTQFRTEFDKDLDDFSSKPGSQIFEKMVSWTYIGDIVRLALKKLRQDDLLLPEEEQSCKLFQQDSITSDRVAMIASDTDSPYLKTKAILTELEVTHYTEEDLDALRNVCGLVCDRATYLTAAALATLINHLNQHGVMIVVDGELNKNIPRFGELLYSITNKLVKPRLTDKFQLVSSAGCRNVGAALIAEASMCQN